MKRASVRLLALAAAAAVVLALGAAAVLRSPTRPAKAASSGGQSLCNAHHPQDAVWYTASCTGHDEPELDPLSSHPGSAKDITWTFVLPTNGAAQVDSVGLPSGSAGRSPTRTASSARHSSSSSSTRIAS